MKESSSNGGIPVSIVKVKYKNSARVVKIPYDMGWTQFESKVCSLFNLTPPITLSYVDGMGVSVIVDTEDDFFFYMDEDFNGRLEVVSKDDEEGSQWTVVRNDTNKDSLVKENDVISYTTASERNQTLADLCTGENTPLDSPKPNVQQFEELREQAAGSNRDEDNSLRSSGGTSRKSDDGHLSDDEDRSQVSKHSAVNSDKLSNSLISGSDKTSSIFEEVLPYSQINEAEPTINEAEVKAEVPEPDTKNEMTEYGVEAELSKDSDLKSEVLEANTNLNFNQTLDSFEASVTSLFNTMVSEQFKKLPVLNAADHKSEVTENPTTLKVIPELQVTTNDSPNTSPDYNNDEIKEVADTNIDCSLKPSLPSIYESEISVCNEGKFKAMSSYCNMETLDNLEFVRKVAEREIVPKITTPDSSAEAETCELYEYPQDASMFYKDAVLSNNTVSSKNDSKLGSPTLPDLVNVVTVEDCSETNSNTDFDHAYNELVEAVEDISSQNSSTKYENETGNADQPSSDVAKGAEEPFNELDLYNAFNENFKKTTVHSVSSEREAEDMTDKASQISDVLSNHKDRSVNSTEFEIDQNLKQFLLLQGVRNICQTNEHVIKTCPSLLIITEILTDQVLHGVPINLEVLQRGIARLNVDGNEKEVDKKYPQFDNLPVNLLEALNKIIKHLGTSINQLIEKDINPFLKEQFGKKATDVAEVKLTEQFEPSQPCSSSTQQESFSVLEPPSCQLPKVDAECANANELKNLPFDLPALLLGGLSWIDKTALNSVQKLMELNKVSVDRATNTTDIPVTDDNPIASYPGNTDSESSAKKLTQDAVQDSDTDTNQLTQPAHVSRKLRSKCNKHAKKLEKKARKEAKRNAKLTNNDTTSSSNDVPVQASADDEAIQSKSDEVARDLNTEPIETSAQDPSEKVEPADDGFLSNLFPMAELYRKPINVLNDLTQNYISSYDDHKFWGSKPHIQPAPDNHTGVRPYSYPTENYDTNSPTSSHSYPTQIYQKYYTPNTTYPPYHESTSSYNFTPTSPTYNPTYHSDINSSANEHHHNYPNQIYQKRYSTHLPEPVDTWNDMVPNSEQTGLSSSNQDSTTPTPTVDTTSTPANNNSNLHGGEEDDLSKSYSNEIDPKDAALISGLATLRDMGFHNDMENLDALQANNCDVLEAVNSLLNYT